MDTDGSLGTRIATERDTEDLDLPRSQGMFRTGAGDGYVLQGAREVGKFVFIGKGLNGTVRSSLEAAVRG